MYEMIEAYLNGSLPEAEHKALEQRMATDEEFRREVLLHRKLKEHFSDPVRWNLLTHLKDIMSEPLPDDNSTDEAPLPTQKKKDWRKPLGLIAFIAVVSLTLWQWRRASHQSLLPSEVIEPPTPTVPPSPTTMPEETTAPVIPIAPKTQENKPAPIATADPANFVPNPAMVASLEGVRGGDWEASMSSPKHTDAFQPNPNGKTTVAFKGSLSGGDAATTFSLFVYNNRDNKRPIFSQQLRTQPGRGEELIFDVRQEFNLQPGLYYFAIVEDLEEAEVWVGKFVIGKRPH